MNMYAINRLKFQHINNWHFLNSQSPKKVINYKIIILKKFSKSKGGRGGTGVNSRFTPLENKIKLFDIFFSNKFFLLILSNF